MKKKILVLAALICGLAIISYGTYAFYQYSDTAHNIITTNGITVKVEEWMDDGNGELVEFPKDSIVIMPGATVSKIVTVRNIDADAFLRCRYECYVVDKNGDKMELTPEQIREIMIIDENPISEEYPEGAYTKLDDGWFYYNTALKKNEVTAPLFTKVYFPPEVLTNEFQNAKLIIDIEVGAVQVTNNADSVFDAEGWPIETDAQETNDGVGNDVAP